MRQTYRRAYVMCALLLIAAACNSTADSAAPQPAQTAPQAAQTAAQPPAQSGSEAAIVFDKAPDEPLPPVPSPYDALPPEARSVLDKPFTGDFEEMVKRRLIRAGVVFNRTQYFIDKGEQRGIVYESLKLFEEQVNKRLKTGKLQVHVVFVPLPRNELFSALTSGKVDLVAAALTITPEREKVAAFSSPTRANVSEIVVTGEGVPPLSSADDLSGREVFVRRSSSYYESLTALNRDFAKRGQPAIAIREAPEALEDDDILEMVNAGLVDVTVVDDFVASFWDQVFPKLHLNSGAAVRTGGNIAVAVRKDNPTMLRAVNIWIKEYGPRTTFGNVMSKRYLQSANYAKNATSAAERKKFEALVKLFFTYGEKYQLDPLLMAAQGYQESTLDHAARSHVGAIGVMQVMPPTGKELNVGDITQLEPNVHAGVKYVRLMMDRYYKDDPMDPTNKLLITLASYNAGPGRIRQLRAEAAKRGLNPNVWFGNVERIASERIGRETVTYVANIYKYYVAYRLALEQAEARRKSKGGGTGAP